MKPLYPFHLIIRYIMCHIHGNRLLRPTTAYRQRKPLPLSFLFPFNDLFPPFPNLSLFTLSQFSPAYLSPRLCNSRVPKKCRADLSTSLRNCQGRCAIITPPPSRAWKRNVFRIRNSVSFRTLIFRQKMKNVLNDMYFWCTCMLTIMVASPICSPYLPS